MLDKLLEQKGNKRRRQINGKDVITTKIRFVAVHLLTKTALLPIRLSENSIALAKHAIDFYTLQEILFYPWQGKKVNKQKSLRNFQK